ncbi:hypothetical protein H0H87_003901 [Tephrocybe sp. NHM501043]|nr:hypothetical protein H0H87_003901 [Tephrocybe sp. NHM501043]
MHVAGSGSNSKMNMQKFNNEGVMVLVCQHNIPLFLANIGTPGEQQKYAISLIQHLFSLLPPNAMIAVLYDVGYILDRSCQLYNIQPDSIANCLGVWINQWLVKGVKGHKATAQKAFEECGVSAEILWAQWEDQMRLQLFIYAHELVCILVVYLIYLCFSDAPACLKMELDSVLSLQGQTEAIDFAIHSLQVELSKVHLPKELSKLLSNLQQMQEEFKEKSEVLYSSLNIHDFFSKLVGVDLEFVQTLPMVRDLNINICKWAIGSFLEWDKSDQAAGGWEQNLGKHTSLPIGSTYL